MSDEPIERQSHRRIKGPEDGMVFAIDIAQCVSFTSMRVTLSKLTAELDRADVRHDADVAQILFLKNVISEQ